jgi:hypothetical protein
MTPEEFERLKEQEKAHLRQLRDLKAQHRDVQRKKSIFDALLGMTRPDLDATHEEQVGKLMQDAAMSEARLDLAMEDAAGAESAADRAAREAAEREALRRAEAEALVRQMKGEMGGLLPSDAPRAADAPSGGKTIGAAGGPPRDPAADPAPGETRAAKSLGRPRSS